jgi:hypothetical protein
MNNSYKLIEEGRKDELWHKHCGYLNLSRQEFRNIQERLMLEQIGFLRKSSFIRKWMGDRNPASIEEFREITPLTSYSDYAEYLMEKNEDDLPEKPYTWVRTSGRNSIHGPKWVPYTKAMYEHLSDPVIGAMLMSSCSKPGIVNLERNDKFLMATAPPPYASGYISRSTRDNLEVVFLPNLEEGEKMTYGDRVATGFRLALREGLDYFMGISIVLARMGEQFEQQSTDTKPSKDLLNPAILWRLIRALIVSKANNRQILPKDLWKLKGIMSGGTDTEIYKDKIQHYWGKKPLEGFACTEGGNLAMQSWNFKGMTFFPDSVFFEFIPMEEHTKQKEVPDHPIKTVLYDELEIGIYELVFSSFYGGVFVRYRIGDFFEVVSIGDQEIGTELPQLKFYSRVDDILDLGGFVRLTERDIWTTIEEAGIPYRDWVVRKELDENSPRLHIYIEPIGEQVSSTEEIRVALDEKLSANFRDYQDMKDMLGMDPLTVTMVPPGSFEAYMKLKMAEGADLAHLKPPHMQPSEDILQSLLSATKR